MLSSTVAQGLGMRSLPVTLLACCVPLFWNPTVSSSVSPASSTPSELPLLEPEELSSTVRLCSRTYATPPVLTVRVPRWVVMFCPETVTCTVPALSARKGSVTLPEASVVPNSYSSVPFCRQTSAPCRGEPPTVTLTVTLVSPSPMLDG